MKLKIALLVAIAALPTIGRAQATTNLEDNPAYIDISKAIDIEKTQPAVNVNLPKFLINEALLALDELSEIDSVEDGEKPGSIIELVSQVKDTVKEIQMIQVLVFEGLDTEQSEALSSGIATLKKQLDDSWTTIVSIPEEGVNIYAISNESGEQMAGFSVLVREGNEAVVANIVGRLPIGKILKLATQTRGIDPRALEEILEGVTSAIQP